MYKFSKYKGEELSEMPIDVGNQILALNIEFSSTTMNSYIYENQNGDLFYVKGILQHTSGIREEAKDDKDDYHLALVVPIVSKESLVSYLDDTGIKKYMFDNEDDCYIMKLGAPEYEHDDGRVSHSMHPVVDRKEVSRRIDLQLKEFEFKAVKTVKLKDLNSLVHPAYGGIIAESSYGLGNDPNWIFTSDEEKEEIRVYCK